MRRFARFQKSTFTRSLCLFAVLAFTCVVLFSTVPGSKSNGARSQGSPQPEKQKKPKDDKCPRGCSPPGEQLIYIPLVDLPEARGGEIVFNSRSAEALDVTPVFYRRNGDTVLGDAVRIESAEIRYVNIRDLLPRSYRGERNWGGFALSYYGANRQMWSQFRFLGVNGGGNVEEFFTVKAESRSPLYEAVWWVPDKSQSIIALGNISDSETSANVTFGDGQTRTVNLRPHATELVRNEHSNSRAESVKIQVTGAAGSIVPTGIITAKDGSFSSVIRFYSPSLTRQRHLFANGFRVAGVTPHMILKNTSSSSLIVQPEFLPMSGRRNADTLVLPLINLGPNEVTEVDLSAVKTAAASGRGHETVSVQIANSGSPGSVIGSLYGVDERTGMSYDMPLRDSGPPRAMTGSYPWKTTDDFRTTVYVTNITDQEAQFVPQIIYPGGHLIFEPRFLAPGETALFDLTQIRDEKRPDLAGNSLPANVSQGQFKWAVRGLTNGKIVLIGRAEMVSRSLSISTSYSCNDPCPPYYGGSIDPFMPPIVINGSAATAIWETAYYDTGYVSGPYSTGASWTLYDPIADIDPSYGHAPTATGTELGGTTLYGFIAMQQDYGWDGLNCYEYGQYEEYADTPVEVVCAVPNNFHQVGAGTDSGGVLHFDYQWGSSTGNLADLSQCTVGEIVSYPGSSSPYVWAHPPFTRSSTNPTVIDVSATSGSGQDDHLGPPFATPFSAASFTATQYYRYKCPCANGGNYVNLMGPISIVRSVTQNANGSWKYTVTKSGSSATVNPMQ